VPENAYPGGGQRGRVRLDERTFAERLAAMLAERPR
jgi:hypothetical protein